MPSPLSASQMRMRAKYGVPESNSGSEFAKNEYQGPDSPTSQNSSNIGSTNFNFNSKDLANGKPNAYSVNTRSTLYGGGGTQPGMGA